MISSKDRTVTALAWRSELEKLQRENESLCRQLQEAKDMLAEQSERERSIEADWQAQLEEILQTCVAHPSYVL